MATRRKKPFNLNNLLVGVGIGVVAGSLLPDTVNPIFIVKKLLIKKAVK